MAIIVILFALFTVSALIFVIRTSSSRPTHSHPRTRRHPNPGSSSAPVSYHASCTSDLDPSASALQPGHSPSSTCESGFSTWDSSTNFGDWGNSSGDSCGSGGSDGGGGGGD